MIVQSPIFKVMAIDNNINASPNRFISIVNILALNERSLL